MSLAETGKEFIEHYGIKGMRWGVRRSQKELDRASSRSEDTSEGNSNKGGSSGSKTATKGKVLDDLSDQELKAVVNRMNMEQQYKRMQPTTFTKKAATFAADIAVNATKQSLTAVASENITKQLKSALAKKA